MVSVQRRLNSTGRKRIARDRVTIELTPPLDAFGFPSATLDSDISELGLDPAARVVLEAYFRSSSMRFPSGTFASIAIPSRLVLTDIDRGGAIQFRLLVIASDGSGRILASAEGLKPLQKSETPDPGDSQQGMTTDGGGKPKDDKPQDKELTAREAEDSQNGQDSRGEGTAMN
jgi:hypothetical protein